MGLWLKKDIYFRICSEKESRTNKNKANYAMYITNIVSAVWHGFYPGYYFAYITLIFFTIVNRKFFKLS